MSQPLDPSASTPNEACEVELICDQFSVQGVSGKASGAVLDSKRIHHEESRSVLTQKAL